MAAKPITNYSTLVFLLNTGVRAIKCAYDPDVYRDNPAKFSLFKTLDTSIKKDDFVVVPTGTRAGYTVIKVVDTDVEIDFSSDDEVKWIATKIDVEAYKEVLQKEEDAIRTVKQAQANAQRRELAEQLKATYGEVSTLAISQQPPAE